MIINPNDTQLRKDEDGNWIALSDQLPGCHASGQSEIEAYFAFQDAAKAHLEALKDTARPIPEAFRDKFVLVA